MVDVEPIALTVQVESAEFPTESPPEQNLLQLIDVAAELRVPVTWFIDPRWATSHPQLCERIAATGGQIGLNVSNAVLTQQHHAREEQFASALARLAACFPDTPIDFVRVPFRLGSQDKQFSDLLDRLALVPVGWTFASRDWDPHFSDEDSLAQIEPALRSGGSVLLHSWPDRTSRLMRQFVETALEKGCTFGGVVPFDLSSGPQVATSWSTHRGKSMRVDYFSDGANRVVTLSLGEMESSVLVRMHSACLTSETLGSTRCDCRQQLDYALDLIHDRGAGVLMYFVDHEGRGIGLEAKLRAYAHQDAGLDTSQANAALGLEVDLRDYSLGETILRDLGVTSVDLITNNPLKEEALRSAGFEVHRVAAWAPEWSDHADHYVNHKILTMDHHDQPENP